MSKHLFGVVETISINPFSDPVINNMTDETIPMVTCHIPEKWINLIEILKQLEKEEFDYIEKIAEQIVRG